MRWTKNFAIPPFAKIDLFGISGNSKNSEILKYRNSFGTFGTYQKGTPVDKEVRKGNTPGFSKYWDVHFCKSFGYLAEQSKLLTERIALFLRLLGTV